MSDVATVEVVEAPATKTSPAKSPAKSGAAAKAEPVAQAADKTLAGGGEAVTTPVPATFPDDWKSQITGGDAKAQKTLEHINSPVDLWKSYKELRSERDSGNFVKVPGKKATAEERTTFNKAMGVPEEPAGYIDQIKLAGDRVLGEADKPIIESFAAAMHPAGATVEQVSKAADWYFDYQQAVQEQQEQSDSEFRIDSEVALKSELGGNFSRATNAIASLFTSAPPEIMDLLLNGRAADGHKLGDHPAVVKWLAAVALENNPAASVQAPDGNNLQAMEDELAELAKLSSNDKSSYWEGPQAKRLQARRLELLAIRDKIKTRAA